MFPGTGHLPFPACDVILSQAIFNPGPGRSAPLPVNTAQMTVLESCEGGSPEACRAQARGPGLPRGETCPCESTRPSPPSARGLSGAGRDQHRVGLRKSETGTHRAAGRVGRTQAQGVGQEAATMGRGPLRALPLTHSPLSSWAPLPPRVAWQPRHLPLHFKQPQLHSVHRGLGPWGGAVRTLGSRPTVTGWG